MRSSAHRIGRLGLSARPAAAVLSLLVPGTLASAQPCSLRAQADANGFTSAGGYSDMRDTGTVTGLPVASINASGSVGGGGCSAASSVMASSAYGTLAISGSGSGVNCPTGSATLYANGTVSFRDQVRVAHPSLPAGTRIPVRFRVAYLGSCSSIQPSSPFCSGTVDVIASITFGQFRVVTQETGIFSDVTDAVTVGSIIDLQASFRRSSGASSPSLQAPGVPALPVSCAHEATVRVTIEPLDPAVTLTACSGHNYLPPCLADFNLDGTVDPDDLADFIACYFQAPPCASTDVNADGTIDPDDLSDFISAFFNSTC